MHTSPLSDWQDQVPVVFLISFLSKIPSNTPRSWFLLAWGCWQDCCCPCSLPVMRSWSFELSVDQLWLVWAVQSLAEQRFRGLCVCGVDSLCVLCLSLTVKTLSFREFKVWFECRFLSAFSKEESVLISSVWKDSLEMLCREKIIVKMVRKNVIFKIVLIGSGSNCHIL